MVMPSGPDDDFNDDKWVSGWSFNAKVFEGGTIDNGKGKESQQRKLVSARHDKVILPSFLSPNCMYAALISSLEASLEIPRSL